MNVLLLVSQFLSRLAKEDLSNFSIKKFFNWTGLETSRWRELQETTYNRWHTRESRSSHSAPQEWLRFQAYQVVAWMGASWHCSPSYLLSASLVFLGGTEEERMCPKPPNTINRGGCGRRRAGAGLVICAEADRAYRKRFDAELYLTIASLQDSRWPDHGWIKHLIVRRISIPNAQNVFPKADAQNSTTYSVTIIQLIAYHS